MSLKGDLAITVEPYLPSNAPAAAPSAPASPSTSSPSWPPSPTPSQTGGQEEGEPTFSHFFVPFSLLKRIQGAAIRFYSLRLDNNSRRTHDLMLYSFFLKLLSYDRSFKTVAGTCTVQECAYGLFFNLSFKENSGVNTETFFSNLARQLTIKNSADAGVNAVDPVVADEEQAGPSATGNVTANANKRKRGGGGRPASKQDSERVNLLQEAHTLVHRPDVPVHRISEHPLFPKTLGWGALIFNEEELQEIIVDSYLCRYSDFGCTIKKFKIVSLADNNTPTQAASAPPPPAPAAAAADLERGEFSDEEGGDEEPLPSASAHQAGTTTTAAAPAATGAHVQNHLRVHYEFKGEHFTVHKPLQFDKFLSKDGILSVLADLHIDFNPAILKITKPEVDLPFLAHRYLAPSGLYNQFQMFSEDLVASKDALLANPNGELNNLSAFFSKFPESRKDKSSAARLIYDLATRPNGRLPKSWAESMQHFIQLLDVHGQRLPLTCTEPLRKYRNVSYCGNYILRTLSHFESVGTFNFHCEQLIVMMTLDGVCFRPNHDEDENGEGFGNSMCGNLLAYGPPGVGKSTASLFFLSAHKDSYITNTYSSLRSIYSNLACSDFLNCRAQYNDEAPAWIPESNPRNQAPGEREQISHLKEKLSSGKMMGERLVRDDKEGIHKTVQFNVDVPNAPMIMNTNAPERSGHQPLLDRFVCRYYMYRARMVPHAIVVGAPPLPTEQQKAIRREFQILHTLLMLTTKMQSDGVIHFPALQVFNSFYENFLLELRDNPFLDCDAMTAGDRRSTIITNNYCWLVTRAALFKLFLDPEGKYYQKTFSVDQLLDVDQYMGGGDIQTAMIAIGQYSHCFRSPTEYRVAELMRMHIVERLREEYAYYGPTDHQHWAGAPPNFVHNINALDFDSYSELSIAQLRQYVNNDAEKLRKMVGSHGRFEDSRYIPYDTVMWNNNNGSPHLNESCNSLAYRLLDSQSSNVGAMQHEHAAKRINMLSFKGAKTGPDVTFKPILFLSDHIRRCTMTFVLRSWLADCLHDNQHSTFHMMKRAAFASSFTSPATYMVLEPFRVDTQATHVQQALEGRQLTQADMNLVFPQLLPSFTVPVHEVGCPARREHEEASPRPIYDHNVYGRHNCTCFRSRMQPTRIGNKEIQADISLLQLASFKKENPVASLLEDLKPQEGGLLYPGDALRQCFGRNGETHRRYERRELDDFEKQVQAQLMGYADGEGEGFVQVI